MAYEIRRSGGGITAADPPAEDTRKTACSGDGGEASGRTGSAGGGGATSDITGSGGGGEVPGRACGISVGVIAIIAGDDRG